MKKIIDDIESLRLLSDDELSEKLLEEKYNKANLRELIKRILKQLSEYEAAFEYQVALNKEKNEQLEDVRKKIKKLTEDI
ncbi:hypothetical protein COA01_32890 [Bacillus cereus]|uniref:hypothetical protein n=1 Tax=Bacillus cereus TaxID=1396 RepID=UPI000C037AD8|nr:hypothetical protein [Bacillus cereus]PGP12615.1 hypothetical protein COA01_32890 [Bacillus cereus]